LTRAPCGLVSARAAPLATGDALGCSGAPPIAQEGRSSRTRTVRACAQRIAICQALQRNGARLVRDELLAWTLQRALAWSRFIASRTRLRITTSHTFCGAIASRKDHAASRDMASPGAPRGSQLAHVSARSSSLKRNRRCVTRGGGGDDPEPGLRDRPGSTHIGKNRLDTTGTRIVACRFAARSAC